MPLCRGLLVLVLAVALSLDAKRTFASHHVRAGRQEVGFVNARWLRQATTMAKKLGWSAGGALAFHHTLKAIPRDQRSSVGLSVPASLFRAHASQEGTFGESALVGLDDSDVTELGGLTWFLEDLMEGEEEKARKHIIESNVRLFGDVLGPALAELEMIELSAILKSELGIKTGEDIVKHTVKLGSTIAKTAQDIEGFEEDLHHEGDKPVDFTGAGEHVWHLLKYANKAESESAEVVGEEVMEKPLLAAKTMKHLEKAIKALTELNKENKEMKADLKLVKNASLSPQQQAWAIGRLLGSIASVLATINEGFTHDPASQSAVGLAVEAARFAAKLIEAKPEGDRVRFLIAGEDITGDVDALRAHDGSIFSWEHAGHILSAAHRALKVASDSEVMFHDSVHDMVKEWKDHVSDAEQGVEKAAEAATAARAPHQPSTEPAADVTQEVPEKPVSNEEARKAVVSAYVSGAHLGFDLFPSLRLFHFLKARESGLHGSDARVGDGAVKAQEDENKLE